ncbi:MAG: SIS domain-containing protein [Phycisphaeraceae bacterium]
MAGKTARCANEYVGRMKELLEMVDCAAIDRYADLLLDAWRHDRAVYVFGNGGSASCASHHVADYVKTAEVDGQRRLRAFSLCDNREMLTAIGNDLSYEDIFIHPLESYARPGDVVVGISCSGNSSNAVKACRWARDHGMGVVALTGFDGGEIGRISDLHINIPCENYGLIEDLQLSIGHIVAQMLQARIIESQQQRQRVMAK